VARSYNVDPEPVPVRVRAVLYDVPVSDRKWTILATVEQMTRYARSFYLSGEKERGRKVRAVPNLRCKHRGPANSELLGVLNLHCILHTLLLLFLRT